MAETRLRELERRWKATGTPEDRAAYVRELGRSRAPVTGHHYETITLERPEVVGVVPSVARGTRHIIHGQVSYVPVRPRSLRIYAENGVTRWLLAWDDGKGVFTSWRREPEGPIGRWSATGTIDYKAGGFALNIPRNRVVPGNVLLAVYSYDMG